MLVEEVLDVFEHGCVFFRVGTKYTFGCSARGYQTTRGVAGCLPWSLV